MHTMGGFQMKELFLGGEERMAFSNSLSHGVSRILEANCDQEVTLCLPPCMCPFADHSIKSSRVTARFSKWEAALHVAGSVAFQNRF